MTTLYEERRQRSRRTLASGVCEAMIVIQTNSGRVPDLIVPVRLVVPAYFVELQTKNSGTRVFDVIAELSEILLPAH